jgi:FKBP-type peptidyl-prolyl cis-trans isomerase (trigger factor)
MKTEVKKIDANQREISVEVTGDVVKNKFEGVFKKINQEAKVPGFRAGHVPQDILEKHYSSHAHEQVLKELIPELYNQAIEKESLDVIEVPDISEVKLDRVTLSFKAKVEVSPQIALKNYKGIKVNYKRVSVSSDEIKRSLDTLKETRKAGTIDDKFARGLGYPDAAQLEKTVERQLYLQKENAERQRIENEVVESITRGLDFKIPQSLVSRQLQDLVRQAKVDLAMRGMPREEIEGKDKELIAQLEPEAKRQVQVYLVLSEIAKKENIAADEHLPRRVMEFLLREADWIEQSD